MDHYTDGRIWSDKHQAWIFEDAEDSNSALAAGSTADSLSVEDIFEFDCHGRNAPAYGCNKPGDNSGQYVRLEKVLELLERGR